MVTRMKNLLFCCFYRKRLISAPPRLSTVASKSKLRTYSITSMAAVIIDQTEWYTAECGRCRYTLPTRYQNLVPIGQGAFGCVIRATDTVTGKYVAIKKMLQPFQSPAHARRTYRELKLHIYLNHPDAQVCCAIVQCVTPEKNLEDFQTLYFVLNFVDYDLNKVIKRQIPFTKDQIEQVIYSLLRGLKFIHSAGVIHRDLKPSKIGVTKNFDVMILDFGLAPVASNNDHIEYDCARWWRAPEMFLNWRQHNEKVDVWSVGCIMAELILLRALFPGENYLDQLTKIVDVIGTPDSATLTALYEPNALNYINGLPTRPKQDFNQLFGFKYDPESETPRSGVSPEGIDFLDRLLTFDHRERLTAEEALSHPFMQTYRDPSDEPTIQPIIDEHQGATYELSVWKSLIWKMIEEFQPPPWATEIAADTS